MFINWTTDTDVYMRQMSAHSVCSVKRYLLLSFKFPKPVEVAPEAWAAPDFPDALPPATALPAAAAAAPGAPGGSANELVLGRPLPLIFFSVRVQGQGESVPTNLDQAFDGYVDLNHNNYYKNNKDSLNGVSAGLKLRLLFLPLSGCVVRPDVRQRADNTALWVM